MATYQIGGTVALGMVYTAQIPTWAMKVLQQKHGKVVGVNLTPPFMQVPSLRVGDLRELGNVKDLRDHWGDDDEIVPMIHKVAYYLTFSLPNGMAMVVSVRGVNARTGKVETGIPHDSPSQSYWSQYAPWIDGYVPAHRDGEDAAVKQFVVLRGEQEMVYDVSNHVGVTYDNPLKDAIQAAFYLPADLRKMAVRQHRYGYGNTDLLGSGLEAASFGIPKGASRDMSYGVEIEEVGVAAGALMRQRHPDNPAVKATDFQRSPVMTITLRQVWVDYWNKLAAIAGEDQISLAQQRQLLDQQKQYEQRLARQIGSGDVQTDVDGFPTLP